MIVGYVKLTIKAAPGTSFTSNAQSQTLRVVYHLNEEAQRQINLTATEGRLPSPGGYTCSCRKNTKRGSGGGRKASANKVAYGRKKLKTHILRKVRVD